MIKIKKNSKIKQQLGIINKKTLIALPLYVKYTGWSFLTFMPKSTGTSLNRKLQGKHILSIA